MASVILQGTGISSPIDVDLNNFGSVGLGLILTLVQDTATFKIQLTGDSKPYRYWNDHDTLVNLTASINGNITSPVSAIRLVITDGTGQVNLSMVQIKVPRATYSGAVLDPAGVN